MVVGGAMQRHRAAPLLMGIGMTTAFAVAGWMLGALGPAMDIDAEWVAPGSGVSLIVFGLALWMDPLANLVSRLVQPSPCRRIGWPARSDTNPRPRRCSSAACWAWPGAPAPARCWFPRWRWWPPAAMPAGRLAAGPVRAGRGHAPGLGRLCVPLRFCAPEGLGPRHRIPACATASDCWRWPRASSSPPDWTS
jgi:hypothetical protein